MVEPSASFMGGTGAGDVPEQQFEIIPINSLAFPRGQLPKCELTGLPGTVQLITPDITLYYATQQHAEQAWYGIIRKIAHLLGPLRQPAPVIGIQEDREKRQYTVEMSKKALIDLCTTEATKFLVRKEFELAVPGAIQAMQFSKDIHGDSSIELVPCYLLLAEANLGMSKLGPAEEFLSLANWSVLQHPDCSNAVQSRLHRDFGRLYTAQGKLDEALAELAKDVYCASVEYGPESIQACGGYHYMANVSVAKDNVENALALYDKVVDIWYKYLATLRTNTEPAEVLAETQVAEGLDMLQQVSHNRIRLLGDGHIASGEVRFTLGLLNLFVSNKEEAHQYVSAALDVYTQQLGSDHASTQDVQDVLTHIETTMASEAAYESATPVNDGGR